MLAGAYLLGYTALWLDADGATETLVLAHWRGRQRPLPRSEHQSFRVFLVAIRN